MNLFRRSRHPQEVPATPAQLGAANTPEVHMVDDQPRVMESVHQGGDEFDGVPVGPQAPRIVRSYRATSQAAGTAAGPVALGTEQTTRAREHLSGGAPDARRNDQVPNGHPAAPDAPYVAASEDRRNVTGEAVVIDAVPAPARPRQGFTGADPTRAARYTRPMLLRAFDQGIAQHPGTVDKAAQPSPTASRPPERRRLVGGLPSSLGVAGTGMDPVGPQRSTVRRTPGTWGEQLVTPGAAAPADTRRARGWRL